MYVKKKLMEKKMTKTELINQLMAGRDAPFMSLNDIAKALRIGKDKAKTILSDCDYIDMGNSRRYLAGDVANALLDMKRR